MLKNSFTAEQEAEKEDKYKRKVKLQLGFRQSLDNELFVTFRAVTRYVQSEKLAWVPPGYQVRYPS